MKAEGGSKGKRVRGKGFYLSPFPFSFTCSLSSFILALHDPLLKRNHCWQAAMLPAAACAPNAALAGSSLLCSRAADCDYLAGVGRALCGCAIGAVARLWLGRCRCSRTL